MTLHGSLSIPREEILSVLAIEPLSLDELAYTLTFPFLSTAYAIQVMLAEGWITRSETKGVFRYAPRRY